ncbi:MAG: ClpX C4-type zinc finger protein [Myxococcaceae bacterium]
MPDDVRQLVMSAQSAEGSGDLRLAQELLEQAARACEAGGRGARAQQLRRHARRLAETLPGDRSRPFLERAPVLADASQAAWCSFCCRPSTEVGSLVAGPAGAYICRGCVERAVGLLGPAARDG